ncbi:MAG: PilZ domain-containing protein [Myxococcales bacterium]|nr:PilZ domain-containing protein [Myxococcales bacterium]
MSDSYTMARGFDRELLQTETLVVELRESGGRAIQARSRNLSVNGIYVDTPEPPEVGTEVQLFVGSMVNAAALRVVATVVHVEPGVGFGARFLDDDEVAHEFVATFLKRVQKKSE